MRKILQTLYLQLDVSSNSLANIALAQLVLKIIYFYEPINGETIRNEVNAILEAKLNQNNIDEAIELLASDGKIKNEGKGYIVTPTRRKKIDVAHQEYSERMERIIKKYFGNTKYDNSVIENWFENVTVSFFTEYKSEWIAQKAYNVRPEKAYDGLKNIVKKETTKDKNFESKDKDWLVKQYLEFFQSGDEDLNSIFWDYGTGAYCSSLITATNSANQITVDTIKNSKFVLDTNILMHLQLEAGKYYNSYNALGEVFKKLNITPGYFLITRDEYLRSIENKRDLILRVADKYEEDVIDELDDDFIKTARSRGCVVEEDYHLFFDTLMDLPKEFIDGLKLEIFDSERIGSSVEKGMKDEALIEELNRIFINRQTHPPKPEMVDKSNGKNEKGKSRRPLEHDAGLIKGIEALREEENCYILTREISVKQYGIIHPIRDEPYISIGLDTLISLLAIDSGGLDINPNNFKPLFAKIIKLALLPEKGTFQIADLSRMLDIEQHIADLPDEDVISIASELHKFQLAGMSDEKISVEIVRKFQNSKMRLKKDIFDKDLEISTLKNQKAVFKEEAEKADQLTKENLELRFEKYWRKKKINYVFHLSSFFIFLGCVCFFFLIKDNPDTNPLLKRWLTASLGVITMIFNIMFNNHTSFKDAWLFLFRNSSKRLIQREKAQFIKEEREKI